MKVKSFSLMESELGEKVEYKVIEEYSLN